MIIYYEIAIAAFGFIVYLIYTEPNAAAFFDLKFRGLWVNIRRYYYILIMKPRIMWDLWQIKRRVKKIKSESKK